MKGMENSIYKTCNVCGGKKHISEFSKSYPNRCKACVAEHTRQVRERAKQERNSTGNTDNRINVQETIDWEQRRYEIAKEVFLYRLKSSPLTNYKDDAKDAVIWADTLISELKKGSQNEE